MYFLKVLKTFHNLILSIKIYLYSIFIYTLFPTSRYCNVQFFCLSKYWVVFFGKIYGLRCMKTYTILKISVEENTKIKEGPSWAVNTLENGRCLKGNIWVTSNCFDRTVARSTLLKWMIVVDVLNLPFSDTKKRRKFSNVFEIRLFKCPIKVLFQLDKI